MASSYYKPCKELDACMKVDQYWHSKEFDKWFDFDVEKGYYTCSKLARLSNITEDMTDKELIEEEQRVIDRLIEIDPLDIYIKIKKNHKNEQK